MVIAAVAVAFVLFVLFFLLKKLVVPSKGTAFLLVGPCGAGKTSMFYQLRDGTTHSGTCTSMKENDDTFPLHGEPPGGAPVHVVDLPGHPRLRMLLDHFLPIAKGIIFVVDAVDFMPQASVIAEHMYDIFAHPGLGRRRVPVMLACNKSDKVTAHTVDFIRKRLEKDIDTLRKTRGSLADSGGGSGAEKFLGSKTEAFKFSQFSMPVTAGSVSVLKNNLGEVVSFMRGL